MYFILFYPLAKVLDQCWVVFFLIHFLIHFLQLCHQLAVSVDLLCFSLLLYHYLSFLPSVYFLWLRLVMLCYVFCQLATLDEPPVDMSAREASPGATSAIPGPRTSISKTPSMEDIARRKAQNRLSASGLKPPSSVKKSKSGVIWEIKSQ